MKKVLLFAIAVMLTGTMFGQLSGIKTIPGDYATIAAAITALNGAGVGAGGVTFNIAGGYTETITAPLSITTTGTLANPIVFQKSGGADLAHRDEEAAGAELEVVVEGGVDADAANVGEEHGRIEGKAPGERQGQGVVVIEEGQGPEDDAVGETRHAGQELVEVIGLRPRPFLDPRDDRGDLGRQRGQGLGWREWQGDVDLGSAVGELALGDEVEDYAVALVVPVPRDEAVELGPHPHRPGRRAQEHLEKTQLPLSGVEDLVEGADMREGRCDVEVLLEVDAGLGPGGHEVGKEPGEMGQVADVGSVASLFCEHCQRIIPWNAVGGKAEDPMDRKIQ